jgi:glycosyltransferase involved in cell wall biosynthesis
VRICIVSQEYPPGYTGGIGTQSRLKAHVLAAQGNEVEVLTAGEESGPALVDRDDGPVRVHEIRIPGAEFAVYRTETYWLGYTWAVLGALRALGEQQPYDVIDFPDYGAEGLAFELDRQDDDPTTVVVHLHGSLQMFAQQIGWPEPEEPLHRVGTFMEDEAIGRADRLLAASRSIAEFTAGRGVTARDQIDVVLGAVDTELFSPAAAPAIPTGEIRLLFVGSIVANKGVRTVCDAFLRLAPAHPELSLTIAGEGDEEMAAQMQVDAARAGLADRLELLGFVEHAELPALYRSADLVAAPSQFEGGLGMVYLEAMASGLPVIATAAGGAAEAVLDGETGILLERGDVPETAAAIERLAADASQRRRMGAAARLRAEREFSGERYAERVAEAYGRAIERRRAALTTW